MKKRQSTQTAEHLLAQLDAEIKAAFFRGDVKNNERLTKARAKLIKSMGVPHGHR